MPALEKSHAMVELGMPLLRGYEENRCAPGSGVSKMQGRVCGSESSPFSFQHPHPRGSSKQPDTNLEVCQMEHEAETRSRLCMLNDH